MDHASSNTVTYASNSLESFYLEILRFIKKDGDQYEIMGKPDKVPATLQIPTQDEKDFIDQYKKLSSILLTYADLYNKFNKSPYKFDDEYSIISKFDNIGINSESPSAASNSKNISDLISTYHLFEVTN